MFLLTALICSANRLDYTGSCARDELRLWINSRTNRRTSRRLKQRSSLPVSGLVLYSKKITGKRAKPAGTTCLTAVDQLLLWRESVVNWQRLAFGRLTLKMSAAQFPQRWCQWWYCGGKISLIENLSLLVGLHSKCPPLNSNYRDWPCQSKDWNFKLLIVIKFVYQVRKLGVTSRPFPLFI